MDSTEPEGYLPQEPDPYMRRAMRLMSNIASRKEKYFESLDDLTKVVQHWRSMGCVIVLTMGSWDLIHIGHANYIEKAKDEARALYPDAEHVILIVGVDSDRLVRERKGPKRPIVNEKERCALISHFAPVDAVILEDVLGFLHRNLQHDVRVISSTTGDLEADEETTRYCKNLVNLPPQAETSTSARVRLLFLEGGQEVMTRFRQGIDKLLEEMKDVFEP